MNSRQRSPHPQTLHKALSVARLLIIISMIAAPLMPSQSQLAQLSAPLADLAKELAPNEATAQTGAPGGVSTNLRLWVKANTGTSTTTPGANVTTWADQSGNGLTMTVTAAGREPTYRAATASANYNPTVLFDGSNDGMELAPFMTGVESGGSVFGAAANNTPGTGFDNLVDFGVDNPHLGTATSTGKPLGYMNGSSPIRNDHPADPVPSQVSLWSWEWDMANEPSNTSSNTGLDVIFNGQISSEPTMEVRESSFAAGAPAANEFQIGSYEAVEVWDGPIGEIVVYDRDLTAAESQRVSSYISLKWGTTLDISPTNPSAAQNYDYVDSGSATIWAGNSTNAGYHNNIAGIGRDDASGLSQIKSKSVNAGFQPTIDNAAAFGADKSFLMWGNDSGTATFGTAYAPTSYTPPAGYFRINRIWKVQETGTVGSVQVTAPAHANLLLVDDDGNFSNGGTTEVPLISGIGTVNFTSGQFFSFGAEATAPGGVAGGLLTWLKADAGVAVGDGAPIPTWTDQSLNGYDVIARPTAAKQPTYKVSTNQVNFNPSIDFDGSQYFYNDNPLMAYNSGYTFGWLARDTYNGGASWRSMYSAHNSWDFFSSYKSYYALGTYNGWIPYGIYGVPDAGYSGNGTLYGPQYNSYWNGANYTANDPRTQRAQAQIFAEASAGAKTDPYNTWVDGYKSTPNWSHANEIGPHTSFFQRFAVGSDYAGPDGAYEAEDFVGQINEFYVYNRPLTDVEMQKVNTYMAIKWGVTLGQGNGAIGNNANNVNYLDTAGGVIWNATANSGYKYNIAGIGRDDAQGLNQKQSRSVQNFNSGDLVTIALGNSIAASNVANTNTFGADKSYMIWGDNGQAANYGVVYSPTTFSPPTGYFRMNRVWKVQESGTVGSVQVRGPASADYMLVSTDPTFATGVTEVALTDDGSGNMVATRDFANGQFFTFGAPLTAPGGVTANLAAWYKADGTIDSTQWNDESGNGKHMLASGDGTTARMPAIESAPGAVNNFNPRVAFLSNADGNRKWTMTASGNNVLTNTTTPGTIFNVSSFPDDTVYDVPQVYAFEDDDPGLNFVTDRNTAGDLRVIFQRDNGGTGSAGWDFGAPSFVQTQPLLTAHAWNYAAGGNTFSFNGYDYTPSSNPFIGSMSPRYIFGAELVGGGGEAHSGYTSENIVYSTDWPSNSNQRKRINSYLAIKYGVTLLGTGTLAGGTADATFGGQADYLNSTSTTIWNGTTTNSAFHNNVAGIGRDDASALNQKQSRSVSSGFQPVIGLGTIAASNDANSSNFSANTSFMVWGSNALSATFGTAYSPTTFTPASGYFRMNRVWKVQETGTVGSVQVRGPSSADYLLVSTDPTFATGVTEVAMSSDGSGNKVATRDFANGEFFTFGAPLTAPGGVAGGLAHWVRADKDIFSDAGNTLATASQTVQQWNDQSSQALNVSANSAGQKSVYLDGTAATNFNPSLDFTSDYLINSSRVIQTTDGVSMFSVGTTRVFNGVRTLYSLGTNGNEPTVDLEATWISPYNSASSPSNVDIFQNQMTLNQPMIWGLRAANNVANDFKFSFQGLEVPTTLEVLSSDPAYGNKVHIGIGVDSIWDGLIMEGITYNRSLSTVEMQQVHSYLAIKYGVTITATDYLATDGTTKIWDATANATYKNNIAGIGRDDAELLNQKQSASVNSGQTMTVAMGLGDIEVTNAANSATFSANKSYEVWGDNGGAATLTANYNGGTNNRITRKWKVQETGTVGTVKVLIPVASAAGLQSIIVNTSNAFASVDRAYSLTVSGGSYEADVDFNNNDFFTFSTDPAVIPPPDLTTTIGQPSPNFVEGTVSNVPMTVTNGGTGPTTGPITSTMVLPTGTSAPASFSSNGNTCTTSGQTVTCVNPGPIAPGGSTVIQVPVTPGVLTVGTQPPFSATTATPGETATGNNAAPTMTPSAAVAAAGFVDLTLTKTASVGSAVTGVAFNFISAVKNNGTIAATNVVLTSTIPATVSYNSSSATSGGNCIQNGLNVVCTWASLASGATVTSTISVTP